MRQNHITRICSATIFLGTRTRHATEPQPIVGCLAAKFSSLHSEDIESIYTDASLELMQNIREGKFSTEGKTNAVGYSIGTN